MAAPTPTRESRCRGPRAPHRAGLVCGVAAALLAALAAPLLATRADLARARTLYNQRQFDEAIEAATEARKTPETQDAAEVVLARAHLERYRERVDPADLGAAREALGNVRAEALEPRDRVEFLLAVGQALFLEDDFGASARVFESGLDAALAVNAALRESMLDWWASAIERSAAAGDRAHRETLFSELSERMAGELARDPGSAAAGYWFVVATRGMGQPLAAWDAAIASWARARLAGARSATLRADLDKLVVQGIIPDRVKSLPEADRAAAESQFRADWELVKERWK
jgi:hypothetical protein